MRFRPCIDLHEGKVKQIVGGTLSGGDANGLITNFVTERKPSEFAKMYRSDGLGGGHVVMLGPGNEEAARDALEAFPGGLQIGGGITPGNADLFLGMGASHVIVTSYVFTDGHIDWERLEQLSAAVGKKRLVVDVSCRKREGLYYVVTDRWSKFTSMTIESDSMHSLARFCDEFLVHAADIEGKRSGVDSELIELLARSSPVPVTYAGGVRTFNDLEIVRRRGGGRVDVTVGSALDIFGGAMKYADVVAWHTRQQSLSGH
jgi:phosphoribosylformimino-5-aminoimidazole carboxamide ribotide isomerase